MRIIVLIIIGIIFYGVISFLFKKYIKTKTLRVLTIVAVVVLYMGIGSVINLNYLSSDFEGKIQQITDTVGESSIKTNGNKVFIKIDNGWYDISKLSVVGDIVTKDIVLKYDGKEIKVSKSGVVNAVKVLEDIGLLKE